MLSSALTVASRWMMSLRRNGPDSSIVGILQSSEYQVSGMTQADESQRIADGWIEGAHDDRGAGEAVGY